MPSILELSRNKAVLNRELLRRIGYTNGLHDIFRFARVVEYLHPIIPATIVSLKAEIAEQENKRTAQSKLSPNKYTQGIIDVARALGLIDKVAAKLSLSDRGYALHAVQNQPETSREGTRAFLLMLALNSDGEYLLNILDLIRKGTTSTVEIGERLMDRMFTVIDIKEDWARNEIRTAIGAETVRSELSEARRVLLAALDPTQKVLFKSRATRENRILDPDERIRRFLEHTVGPRREWLADLGCISANSKQSQTLTKSGQDLIAFFDDVGCKRSFRGNESYVLPLSENLCEVLDARNLIGDARDLFWKAIAVAETGSAQLVQVMNRALLDRIKAIYVYVRLYGFNEAEISSVFHTLSCQEALSGCYLSEQQFEEALLQLAKDYPSEIFRLSKRRGVGGYIALKRPENVSSI
jgi:hypothetical protein